MARILLIETASIKRIREKAEQILADGAYPNPEITILCHDDARDCFRGLPGVRVCSLAAKASYAEAKKLGLDREEFDLSFAFWTGEKEYRRWKLLGMRLKAKETRILSGDGNEFRLTWKAMIRHTLFRCQHPLPTDYWDYNNPEEECPQPTSPYREKVLIIQSAEPVNILQGLERLRKKPLFRNPRYTVFCRNRPEIVQRLQGHPMISELVTHSETRGSWSHLRNFRRQRFKTVIVFFTGDPSYWKVKLFAWMVGARRVLVFNESCDCFFFNWHQWIGLLASRLQGQSQISVHSKWTQPARILVSLILKSVILPFRFLWLLLIWLRLRLAGLKSAGYSYDDPL